LVDIEVDIVIKMEQKTLVWAVTLFLMIGYASNFSDTFLVSPLISVPIFVAIRAREVYSISRCLEKFVLAEKTPKKTILPSVRASHCRWRTV